MKKLIALLIILVPILSVAQHWSAVGSGTNGGVNCFTIYNNELIAGGDFDSIGGFQNKLGRWNGVQWDTLPNTSAFDYANALGTYNGNLFVGFHSAPYLLQFDGTTWSQVGLGLNGEVNALIEFDSSLYVGGNFTMAGGSPATYIARWDGTSWSAVGPGMNNLVECFAIFHDSLFVGGGFSYAGVPVENVAKWNGASFEPLLYDIYNGVNATVQSMMEYNGFLFIAGQFSPNGSYYSTNFAKWTGSTMMPYGTGVSGPYLTSLAVCNNLLYVGGDISSVGSLQYAYNIVAFDAWHWSILGSYYPNGVQSTVSAAICYNNDLYVGGAFQYAVDTIPVRSIARWTTSTTEINDVNRSSIELFPNPFNHQLQIKGTDEYSELIVQDVSGRTILDLYLHGEENEVNMPDLVPGIYIACIKSKSHLLNFKLIRN